MGRQTIKGFNTDKATARLMILLKFRKMEAFRFLCCTGSLID